MRQEFSVAASEAGSRLDRVLLSRIADLSRAELWRLFGERKIRVNGQIARKGDPVGAGDHISVELGESMGAVADADMDLDVVLETPHIVVINKQPGVPSAPRRGSDTGCVANGLLARYPEMGRVGHHPLEPGLLHRLDNDTSGLLVAARNEPAFDTLTTGLKSGDLKKTYLALVESAPGDAGTLSGHIGPNPEHRQRVHFAEPPFPGSRPASLSYRLIDGGSRTQLLEVSVRAAYRHQIRAQLAFVGSPIVGDPLYGGAEREGLTRHGLHASQLAWAGSDPVASFDLCSSLPPDLSRLLRS